MAAACHDHHAEVSPRHARRWTARRISLLFVVLLASSGCDGPPPNATGANPPVAPAESGSIRLTAEKVKSAGITVQPLRRGEFRTFRDFPGTVETGDDRGP